MLPLGARSKGKIPTVSVVGGAIEATMSASAESRRIDYTVQEEAAAAVAAAAISERAASEATSPTEMSSNASQVRTDNHRDHRNFWT